MPFAEPALRKVFLCEELDALSLQALRSHELEIAVQSAHKAVVATCTTCSGSNFFCVMNDDLSLQDSVNSQELEIAVQSVHSVGATCRTGTCCAICS